MIKCDRCGGDVTKCELPDSTCCFSLMAREVYETAYRSMPPVDLGSAAARRVLVPALAVLLRQVAEGRRS